MVTFCAERGLRVGNTYYKNRSLHKYTSRRSGGKEHDKSDAGKEGYAALCARCEGGGINGTRPLRSPCGTV